VSHLTPLYPLKDVCDLAKAGKVGFSKKAQKDVQEQVGYTLDQAMECVAWLTSDEFRTRLFYEDLGTWWDDYVITRRFPDGTNRKIYVKLRIPAPSSANYVMVTSFHFEGC